MLAVPPQRVILLLSDLFVFMASLFLSLCIRAIFGGLSLAIYDWMFLFILCVAPLMAALFGLYRTGSLPVHRELQAVFCSTSLIYAVILAIMFISKTADDYSRAALLCAWLLTLIAMPMLRHSCREYFSHRHWWGEPLLICDQSNKGKAIWHSLRRNLHLGLRPVGICKLQGDMQNILATLDNMSKRFPRATALVSYEHSQGLDRVLITEICFRFGKVLLVPTQSMPLMPQWLMPYEFGQMNALLVRQNLRCRWRQWLKRALDLLICIPMAILLLIPSLVLCLLVRLDSKGAVIYSQERIGRNGAKIKVLKFRTMVCNGDAILAEYLANNPEAKAQWEANRKLQDDPRITRMGKWLRRTSIDELPQLINILLGEMSLVGPRPIVAEEIAKYGNSYVEYCRVRPGLTGLWQISGRNNTTYSERVGFDCYYVSNWSIWLDMWIILKTPGVIISGNGAC